MLPKATSTTNRIIAKCVFPLALLIAPSCSEPSTLSNECLRLVNAPRPEPVADAPSTPPASAEAPDTTSPYDEAKKCLEVQQLSLQVRKLNDDVRHAGSEPEMLAWLLKYMAVLSLLGGGIAALYQLYRVIVDRRESRFEKVVASLGSEHLQERIGAAVLLRTFLKRGYERDRVQVFNLAAANLRRPVALAQPAGGSSVVEGVFKHLFVAQSPLTPSLNPGADELGNVGGGDALHQLLATVLREAYPLARERLRKDHKGAVGKRLNGEDVWLDGMYLAKADFDEAWLRNAQFRKADLKGATFDIAMLEGSDFSEAELHYAEFKPRGEDAVSLRNSNFTGAKLPWATLTGNMEGATFAEATLHNTTFRDGNMKGVNFDSADLKHVKFINVEFDKDTSLSNAQNLDEVALIGVFGLSEWDKNNLQTKGDITITDQDDRTN